MAVRAVAVVILVDVHLLLGLMGVLGLCLAIPSPGLGLELGNNTLLWAITRG